MLTFIIGLLVAGLVIGALGRLVVPGPNPMGIFTTILCGWAGSFLGGLVGRLLIGWRYRYSFILALVLAVAFTALIVYAISSRQGRTRRSPRPS
ncbi:MAG: GlsB/YeaQ/YmgE family stress response membrane protein [Acidimicrobiales bacterium]